ncbi:MAG: signal peptidase II [bacterium]|nr:signal peptidase II [bacterium]
MKPGARTVILFAVNGLFLLLDRIFKIKALLDQGSDARFNYQLFAWHPFFNYGVAFGIRLPPLLTICSTVAVIILLVILVYRDSRPTSRFALSIIITGAISNLYDRIAFGYTVDYLSFFTAVINFADIGIVTGFVIYLLQLRDTKRIF